jgi:hypothetical protein
MVEMQRFGLTNVPSINTVYLISKSKTEGTATSTFNSEQQDITCEGMRQIFLFQEQLHI